MKRSLSIVLCIILVLGVLCGCGASTVEATISADSAAVEAPNSSGMDYGYYAYEEAESSGGTGAAADTTSVGSIPANTKLIYTAWLELETTTFDESVAGLKKLVADMGGYFELSQLNNYGTYRNGNYTVRVPAESFDAFCSSAGQLCQLNSIERSAEDISESYYDTESRLATQQTKLERLQELLSNAESMEDIIALESSISETELNIERLTGTLRKYDSLVGYSTVTIYLQEVYELSEIEEPVIGFGAKLMEAFKRGSSNFVDSLQRSLLRFARNWVGWIIWILVIALVVFFVVRHVRRRREGRPFLRRKTRNAPPTGSEDNGK